MFGYGPRYARDNNNNNNNNNDCRTWGRKCDGVHSNHHISKETQIQKMTSILESYGDAMVDEIIQQIYENRRIKTVSK